MKRLFLSLIVLFLLTNGIGTLAEGAGLFESIVQANQLERAKIKIPSYSYFAKTRIDVVDTSDTEITHTYKNVSLEAFGAYGEYLGNNGYKVTNSAEVDDHYTLELSKGNQNSNEATIVIGADTSNDASHSFVVEYIVSQKMLKLHFSPEHEVLVPRFLGEVEKIVVGDGRVHAKATADHFGNTYFSAYALDKGSVLVILKKEFKTFSGVIACPQDIGYHQQIQGASLIIYADGKKVYNSPICDYDNAPIPFEVDVTGCEQLKIEWEAHGGNIWHDWGERATIFNGVFLP